MPPHSATCWLPLELTQRTPSNEADTAEVAGTHACGQEETNAQLLKNRGLIDGDELTAAYERTRFDGRLNSVNFITLDLACVPIDNDFSLRKLDG